MLQCFFRPAQPADLYSRFDCLFQTEMQSQIVLRTETSSASNLLHLPSIISVDDHTRADRSPVRFGSQQLHQQPGVRRRRLIAQQGTDSRSDC